MSDQSEADAVEADRLLLECRVCLEEKSVRLMSWDIFTPLKERGFSAGTTIALELSRLARVEIQDVEGYPKYICKKCLENLVSAIELVRDVKSSEEILLHKKLTGKLDLVQIWPKPIELDKNISEEVLRNSMDVDVKQEIISDEEFGDTGMDDDKQDNLSLTDIKVEPDDIAEHPAIQVTVNDSRATNIVKDSEESINDPLLQYDKNIPTSNTPVEVNNGGSKIGKCDQKLKSILSKAIQDLGDKSQNRDQPMNAHNIQKELLVMVTKIENTFLESTLRNKTSDNLRPSIKKRNFKQAKKMGPPCDCKIICRNKISYEQRQNICNYYHSQNTSKQREFVINFTSKEKIHKRKLTSNRNRNATFKYYLPLDITFSDDFKTAEKVRVCKIMFMNTLAATSKMNTERVWKSYESFKMVDGRGRHRRKIDTDAVNSICAHFKELQNNKLTQLKPLSSGSGSQRKPIRRLTFNKMFKLYRLWVLSKDYARTVQSQDTYKRIILKYIPHDQILTLQNGKSVTERSKRSRTNKMCDDEEFPLILVKNDNSGEICPESLEVDLLANSAFNEAEIKTIDSIEENETENKFMYVDDFIKNYSDPVSTKTTATKDASFSEITNKNKINLRPTIRKRNSKQAKKMGPPCDCKMKCCNKISFEQRQNICNYYHTQNTSKQREFVINFTSKEKIHMRKLTSNRNRNVTFKYYLPFNISFSDDFKTAEKVRVCKIMFMNTLAATSKTNTERVWKSYETFKMVDGRGRHRRNMDTDAVNSICAHFKELQNNKLTQLKALSSGSRLEPINKLTFNKMFKLYRLWVLSKDYARTVQSQDTYKRIILKCIPHDQIHTLQKGKSVKERRNRSRTNKMCDDEEVPLMLVKNDNSEETCPESLEVDLFAISALNEAEIKTSDPIEENKTGIEFIVDDDLNKNYSDSGSESEVSNFSEDFKEEINQENNIEIKKKENIVKREKQIKSAEESTCESSDEDYDIENIKKDVVRLNMCTRNKSDKTQLELPSEGDFNLNIAFMHNDEKKNDEEALLTAKRKRPTRDPAVIRRYCKYHGLAYETESGTIIPKKVLGPPCACSKHCADKLSQDQRQFIFNHFWGLGNKKEQMLFVRKFTIRVKTRIKLVSALKNRDYGFNYFLPTTTNLDKDEKIKVCFRMFYNTLKCSTLLTRRVWNEAKKKRNTGKEQQEELSMELAEVSEEVIDEIVNEDNSKLEQSQNSRRKRKRVDPNHDNTLIDFVYRAMPFHEFMNHFGKERNKESPCDANSENKIRKRNNKINNIIRKNHGKRYINSSGKIVAERSMGPPCQCKTGCSNKITDEQRLFVFEYYWSLGSFSKQKAFIVWFSSQTDTKSHINGKHILREKHYEYYLPVTKDFDGEKVKVCQVMLMNTLAVGQRCISSAWLKYEQGQFSDDRGKHTKGHRKVTDKFVSAKDHIDFLRREDPELNAFKLYSKQYPDGIISPNKLFKLYNEWFDAKVYSVKIKSFKAYLGIYRRIKKLFL